jgi:hypothetical protein
MPDFNEEERVIQDTKLRKSGDWLILEAYRRERGSSRSGEAAFS